MSTHNTNELMEKQVKKDGKNPERVMACMSKTDRAMLEDIVAWDKRAGKKSDFSKCIVRMIRTEWNGRLASENPHLAGRGAS